ncbi:MAG TPA: DUF362 domain-containing protein [Candidatus Hydrogenedentes bacterium]|mgnify:FL=1|nr:DUF362 domain-containing protein [Candidatus Hydrogenedentota bacterium]HPC15533.1 DUF362 domain-containing protein [Candidatus Hydrogenedentota bacterium]HRT19353.1 DUF362 domain-containing protein [Candidatus Hydrogenedentota bacterium]HRT63913.1 DUF362 domain-containing protein [Candidatus Hydrogenedentota bacterium]
MPAKKSSVVTFASSKVKELRRHATLPVKFEKQLAQYPLDKMFRDKQVAIKIHVGSDVGFTTIHPLFIRIVVEAVKKAGGKPFITDGSGAMHHAKGRGYTEEVLGAPLIAAAGIANTYSYERKIGYRSLKSVHLCGNIVDADAMIVLSHGKGHGNSGFGAAIKNLAMGCVARDSRAQIHRLQGQQFKWDPAKCTRCRACIENCPSPGTLTFDATRNLHYFDHHCRYCRHCELACPKGAIKIDSKGTYYFQRGMALTTKAVLDTFEPNRVLFINVMLNITPFCDCWGFSTPALVPDVGILAATDIVAVEQASLDLVRTEDFIASSLPKSMKLGKGDHLFERIHGKNPYLQVQCAEEIGLGSRAYTLKTIG